jgi:hypothetical protein
LVRITKGTRPDFVVLEYHIKAQLRVLCRAHIYEAKTGQATLTPGQEAAFLEAGKSQAVDYKVIHVEAAHVVPTTAKVTTLSSRDSQRAAR